MTDALAAALVAAQAEMPKVEKRGRNPHFKNEYVTLDDLIEAVRPVLNRHGLAVVQPPATLDGNMPALKTILLHGPSGETLESTMPLILQKGDMQGVGSAITYGRRYMLAAMLGIAEGVDDDGNQASAPPGAAAPGKDGGADRAAQDATGGPSSPAPPKSSLITPEQRKRLFAIFGETGFPEAVLRDPKTGILVRVLGDYVKDAEGRVSTNLIPKNRYDDVIRAIQGEDTDIPW